MSDAHNDAIYDEELVPDYALPDPLLFADGTPVRDATDWVERRRPELLQVFQTTVYGRSPAPPKDARYQVTSVARDALDGLATRKQVTILLRGANGKEHELHLLLYIPNRCASPPPVFVSLTWTGNQEVHTDPGIDLHRGWAPDWRGNGRDLGVRDNRPTEASRGAMTDGWCVNEILSRGYALATVPKADLDPDYDDGFRNGVHPLYYQPGQTRPASDEWGTVGAWAWGMSRILDYLTEDQEVDAGRAIVTGTSRLGKTALWAGALDERFAMVIPNESGCGGAALSRRRFGETVERINRTFPHWFCGNFHAFGGREDDLPVDQHELIALVAPRPVYVASAQEDLWSDPRGEFLAALHASPVYRLLGRDGLLSDEMPAIHEPISSTVGYHIRAGTHGIVEYDWQRFMDFADIHLGKG